MSALRIGIDIGGTFTDAALVDGETGAIRAELRGDELRGDELTQ